MNQKSMAAFLVGGLIVIGGAGTAAVSVVSGSGPARQGPVASARPHASASDARMASASQPMPSPTDNLMAPSTTTPAPEIVLPPPPGASALQTPAPAPAPSPGATVSDPTTVRAPSAPITYTVKRGDNLSTIAWWFHVRGYGAIYDANKAVIGNNPDLIFAGQTITIAGNVVSMGG